MNDNKKKRYPTDRLKLHALLEKKEQSLQELRDEIEELRQIVKKADFAAFCKTAEDYDLSPERLTEIMQKMFGDPVKPSSATPANKATAGTPEQEETTDDKEA